jgi:tetratricopeptide (TPR) repeat protein
LLILQIKQAETALNDGRLDEAFTIAQDHNVQTHRQGQRLIDRLVKSLVERGREHLEARRFGQASADCDKAVQLGGNLTEIAQLRSDIAQAATDRQRSARKHADALAEARQHIDRGQLSVGEHLLEKAAIKTERVQALQANVAERRVSAEDALIRAQQALGHEDWDTAVKALLEIKRSHSANKQLADLTAQLTDGVIARAKSAIDEGRVDLAESLLHRLVPLGHDTIQTRDLNKMVEQCRMAAQYIVQGRPRQASEILRLMSAIQPEAVWIKQALTQTQQEAEMLEELRGGPLGLLMDRQVRSCEDKIASTMPYPAAGAEMMAEELQDNTIGEGLPPRFIMHIDGVGSFIVLRGRSITIGSSGSSYKPDLPLMLEAGIETARIERDESDYFLESDKTVFVNDTPVKHKLLADDDRIALSQRCRLKFTRPNPASASAVLQVQGTRLPGCDARQAILMDREIIFAPGSTAHVRADHLAKPVIFHTRDNRLFCRTDTEVLVNDRPMDRHLGIPLGANVKIGNVSLVVTKM